MTVSWLTSRPIAHRGLHSGREVPENSLAAFERATAKGCPIELDVQLISDGNMIVFHDDDLLRMAGLLGKVREKNYSTLRGLRLYETNQHIPLLNEVLESVSGKVPLLIEVKNKGKVGDCEKTLWKILEHYRGEFAVQSFNPFSLAWFKTNAPGIIRGQLSGDFRDLDLPSYKKFILRRLWLNRESEPHFLAYDHRCLPNRWVDKERLKRRIPVLAWTVTSSTEYERVHQYADNVIFEGFEVPL